MNKICQRYRCLQLIINVGITTVISVTMQMLDDAKGVIRSRNLKDSQCSDIKEEGTKWSTKHKLKIRLGRVANGPAAFTIQ